MSKAHYKELVSHEILGLNAKSTGSTLIGTTENGTEKFYPVFISIVCSSASAITIVPTISIGTNSTSYNNLMAATSLTNLSVLGNMSNPSLVATYANIPANTGIYANVTIGATATTALVDIRIFGYYN